MLSEQKENTIFELFLDDIMIYSSTNVYYVFHEYLSYNKLNKIIETNRLIIKKKLNDPSKKFPLYFETIDYDKFTNRFYSSNNKNKIDYYAIDSIKYLADLCIQPQSELKTKVQDKKKIINTKIKVIDYKPNLEPESEPEPEITDEKLAELEELIENMENLKEQEKEKLIKEQNCIAQTEMIEREEKTKARVFLEKKKELENIYTSDKRLYYKFKEIKSLIKNNNIPDKPNFELTQNELTAKSYITSNKEFMIPLLFLHKYPIFEFLDNNNFINHDAEFFIYKLIYYTNYELNTESRKFYGDEIYLLNAEETEFCNNNITNLEQELIDTFEKSINNNLIDIEKLVSTEIKNNNNNNTNINNTIDKIFN